MKKQVSEFYQEMKNIMLKMFLHSSAFVSLLPIFVAFFFFKPLARSMGALK